MRLEETTPHREEHLEEAIRLLESHSDFSRVQVRMREWLEEATRKAPPEACAYGSRARLNEVLQRFDIRAQAFLELVSDMPMQNAYMAVLQYLVRVAWEEYTGGGLEVIRPASDQSEKDLHSIDARMARWVKAGYERLAKPCPEATSSLGHTAEPSPQAGARETVDSEAGRRRSAVNAYLAEVLRVTGKKITRTDFWESAGYRGRTEFERWERNDPKHPNKTAHCGFTRILTEKPHLKKN